MDHKVSKDMISSGMIPSGEKTQADLSRIQYGSAPSPSKLMDAYKSMYEHHQKDKDGNTIPHQEDLNEGKKEKVDENTLLKGIQTVERGRESLAKNIGNVASTVGSDIKSAASTVYKDVKGAIKNRYQKFKDHQKARGMGLDLKKGKISPDGTYSSRSKDGGYSSFDLRFDTDLFDLVKGDLISEGLTDGEASRMMLEMHEEITFLYNLSEEQLNEFGVEGDGYLGPKFLNIKNPVPGLLNKARDKSPIGGNKRVDDVRKGSGDNTVGKKIYY